MPRRSRNRSRVGILAAFRLTLEPALPELIFVYGTLKQGHCNEHVNQAVRVPGRFRTVEPHPLYIIGAQHLPWLLPRPGQGLPVVGELYEADEAALARMDVLEQVDEPGWYERRRVEVRPAGDPDGATRPAWVYFGTEAGFARHPVRHGPIEDYTPEIARRFPLNDYLP